MLAVTITGVIGFRFIILKIDFTEELIYCNIILQIGILRRLHLCEVAKSYL